jgi:hypothetical protein
MRINVNDDRDDDNPSIAAVNQNNLWVFWCKEFGFWDFHIYTRHFDGTNWTAEEQLDNNDSSYCNIGTSSALDMNLNPWVVFIGIPYSRSNFEVYSNRHFSTGIEENTYARLIEKGDFINLKPNPFTEQIKIRYNLSTSNNVKVRILNALGRDIIVLLDKFQEPGEYTLCWKSKDNQNIKLPAGVYFCEISAGKYAKTTKIVLSRYK